MEVDDESGYKPLLTPDSKAIIWGMQTRAVQVIFHSIIHLEEILGTSKPNSLDSFLCI
jgi:hypothetical protein